MALIDCHFPYAVSRLLTKKSTISQWQNAIIWIVCRCLKKVDLQVFRTTGLGTTGVEDTPGKNLFIYLLQSMD